MSEGEGLRGYITLLLSHDCLQRVTTANEFPHFGQVTTFYCDRLLKQSRDNRKLQELQREYRLLQPLLEQSRDSRKQLSCGRQRFRQQPEAIRG